MSTGPTNLYDLAAALLAAVVAQFSADDVPVPDRQFVTGVAPVPYCETLAVAYDRIFVGTPGQTPGQRPASRAEVRSAVLTVTIFRCLQAVAEGEGMEVLPAPTQQHLSDDARTLMTDAYTLHRAVYRAHYAGQFGAFTSGLAIGEAVPLPAEAGIAGTRLTVTAELS